MRQPLLVTIALLCGTTTADAGSFTPLGDLSGGIFHSRANDVSNDGSVVVGTGVSANGVQEAFRWSASTGMVGLGDLGSSGVNSEANAVSADGSVVVGRATVSQGVNTAFRWTSGTGMVGLGFMFYAPCGCTIGTYANDVSPDGTVVVGNALGPLGFRWTESTGIVELPNLPNGESVRVNAVSADGVAYGSGDQTPGIADSIAVSWQPDGTVAPIEPAIAYSRVTAASDSGAFLVGTGDGGGWIWNATDGYTQLATSDGGIEPFDVSAGGSVVVGRGQSAVCPPSSETTCALVWDPELGLQSLFNLLVARGAMGLEGWTLNEARGLSDDGRYVVGFGTNPSGHYEAFLADLSPVPVPAAAWLFVGALGALIGMRRSPAAAVV